jgi:thiamine kinase-like enzyme
MIVWEDPLVDNFKMAQGDLLEYEAKKTPNPEIIRLSKKLLARIEPNLNRYRSCYSAEAINHTDDAIDNFIRTPKGLRLIDWEKPRIDDPSYDVCCFLCEPAELWCSPSPLSAAGREIFLKTYIHLSGKEEQLFLEKVRIREPVISLHWVLWGANKLCDLRDQRTSDGLLEVHRLKVDRWERFANPLSIEKILDTT